ncbi:hypothetical protein PIROE2DRAFT_1120 [Piromyces sp. E2]|nr:hypothetical protein PIROE2DRAFT_1120 [Piromyces sp. E2]|eukprot:OUM70598.1 hypothetical protein PIROE2DRAFT_1120 [Piromyces sp. E2]
MFQRDFSQTDFSQRAFSQRDFSQTIFFNMYPMEENKKLFSLARRKNKNKLNLNVLNYKN